MYEYKSKFIFNYIIVSRGTFYVFWNIYVSRETMKGY